MDFDDPNDHVDHGLRDDDLDEFDGVSLEALDLTSRLGDLRFDYEEYLSKGASWNEWDHWQSLQSHEVTYEHFEALPRTEAIRYPSIGPLDYKWRKFQPINRTYRGKQWSRHNRRESQSAFTARELDMMLALHQANECEAFELHQAEVELDRYNYHLALDALYEDDIEDDVHYY
jgi:hypothetical protein